MNAPEVASSCRKIGLTGGVACGKTRVSEYFAALGVPVLDADVVARQLAAPGLPAWKAIHERFGNEILLADGHLDRPELRRIIFADPASRQGLEAILHPRIRNEMENAAAALDAPYCILCIPLLVETRQWDWVDRVLVVDCEPVLQRERLARRDGLDNEQINSMLEAQCSPRERLRYADDVICNNCGLSELHRQTLALHRFYSTWSSRYSFL